jgi:hypothetical protein
VLWIILTASAAPLQVARNALQRGLIGDAGPWGATLVRFLFGLPFSLAIFGVAAAFTPDAAPHSAPATSWPSCSARWRRWRRPPACWSPCAGPASRWRR